MGQNRAHVTVHSPHGRAAPHPGLGGGHAAPRRFRRSSLVLLRSDLGVERVEPKGRAVKVLYLLRHAKSSWDDPVLSDHERPLAPRGRRAAARIADAPEQGGNTACADPLLIVPADAPDARAGRGGPPGRSDACGGRPLRRRRGKLLGACTGYPTRRTPCSWSATTRASRTWPSRWPRAATPRPRPPSGQDADGALATLAAPVTRWPDLRPGERGAGGVRGTAGAELRARRCHPRLSLMAREPRTPAQGAGSQSDQTGRRGHQAAGTRRRCSRCRCHLELVSKR